MLARAGGHHLGGEQRREDEQRRDPREDEHEAGDLLLAELREQVGRVHPPTSAGICP